MSPRPSVSGAEPPRQIRVVIVDDAVVVRRLLTEALNSDPEVTVVGAGANGRLGLAKIDELQPCLLYTSPSPRDRTRSRMPSSA